MLIHHPHFTFFHELTPPQAQGCQVFSPSQTGLLASFRAKKGQCSQSRAPTAKPQRGILGASAQSPAKNLPASGLQNINTFRKWPGNPLCWVAGKISRKCSAPASGANPYRSENSLLQALLPSWSGCLGLVVAANLVHGWDSMKTLKFYSLLRLSTLKSERKLFPNFDKATCRASIQKLLAATSLVASQGA